MNRKVVVYDLETLRSCFTYSDINVDTEEVNQFVIHESRNDLKVLIDYLNTLTGQVGFNNINFDYPIIHMILQDNQDWLDFSPLEICDIIHRKAQWLIESQNKENFNNIISIPTKSWLIHQVDLFKMWHYNNKARRCSLKALEIAMNFPNVMEMPIDHHREDITVEEIPSILEYNLNDVLATFEFLKRSKEKVNLRKQLIEKYDIPCLNFSDSKIGEQLVLKLYCIKTGKNYYEVKEQRTYRPKIQIAPLIFPIIKFQTKEFNDLLDFYKKQVITKTKGDIDKSVIFRGFKYDFASGGLHGCIKAGIYEEDDYFVIKDLDVSSLYPSIPVLNNLYPRHLGREFCEIYKGILEERIEAKRAGNMAISDALKLALNSVYGKSNDHHSFLYDPQFTMTVTINGQLLLAMLAEQLVLNITDIIVLQVNTDGITIKLPKNQLEKYYEICKKWEEITRLTLEFTDYKKMAIRDVNNYTAIYTSGKTKNKGCFEVEKVVGNEIAYHKDNSFKIVPIALEKYFSQGINIEYTIRNHKNIYDFCGRQKFTIDSYGEIYGIGYDKNDNPIEYCEKQQKNVRYYISTNGYTFVKQYKKGTSELINKGYKVTIFNNFEQKENYSIDYSFYIRECRKITEIIEDKQLQLF